MSSSAQDHGSAQSYRGTVGYISPEMYQARPAEINFRKCDIWALGLAVWEVLADGFRYTEYHQVESLLHQEKSISTPAKLSRSKEDFTGYSPTSRPGYEFFLISKHLCQLAVDRAELIRGVSAMSRALVKQIFRMSLQQDPTERCGDVSRLPFTYSKNR